MILITKEEKIVFELLRGGLCKKNTQSSFKSDKGIDWAKVAEIAHSEGIAHILYHQIKCESLPVPGAILGRLEAGYYDNIRKNTILLYELGKLIKDLSRINIFIVVLKGAALAETVYKNVGLRAMSDIDILVKPKDLKSIDERLTFSGFRVVNGSENNMFPSITPFLNTYLYKKDGGIIFLHVHWHIINSTIPTYSHIFNVNMKQIWDKIECTEIGETEALILSPHHLIIHLCEHGLRVRHSLNRLILLYDIAKSVSEYGKSIDWDRLVKDSLQFNLDRMVFFSLYLSREYFLITIPEKVLFSLKPKSMNRGEKRFLSQAEKNIRKAGYSYWIHFAMNEGFINKIQFIWRTLFPPKIILDIRGSSNGRFYTFHRIREIMMYFLRLSTNKK